VGGGLATGSHRGRIGRSASAAAAAAALGGAGRLGSGGVRGVRLAVEVVGTGRVQIKVKYTLAQFDVRVAG
jgi:hypothetical protein